MKKAKISFRIFGDSGPLTLSWFSGPKGSAVESKNGVGVGFFSETGQLLCVEFDDVNKKKDHQILDFGSLKIETTVSAGKVSYSIHSNKTKTKNKAEELIA